MNLSKDRILASWSSTNLSNVNEVRHYGHITLDAQNTPEFPSIIVLTLTLNESKTHIVHVSRGFEFLGYKIKRGSRRLALPSHKIRSGTREGDLYAYPREKSIQHFMDQIRKRTRRKAPVDTRVLIAQINPVIRGWGLYFCKANIRKLFARLDRWILRRIWSHRFKRWRCRGWRHLPERRLYNGMGLVRLVFLIPSLNLR